MKDNKEFEYEGFLVPGAIMLLLLLVAVPAALVYIFMTYGIDPAVFVGIPVGILEIFLLTGFFVQQPNQARVMVFFGNYKGTVRKTGFFWVNPFMTKIPQSLRLNNMDIEPIKVNDKIGNPVLIGMVLVWKIDDTYRATFDVDQETGLSKFVRIQSDAALREVTGQYAYDNIDGVHDEITLRSGGDEISDLLEAKVNERLAMAGITIVEARINYLAYAPEIAAVMLRRQQAAAIISAREKIVEGAVSMVKMALKQLDEEQVVNLDEERKAAMVSNMLVVLCADEPAQPIVNAGTLHH